MNSAGLGGIFECSVSTGAFQAAYKLLHSAMIVSLFESDSLGSALFVVQTTKRKSSKESAVRV